MNTRVRKLDLNLDPPRRRRPAAPPPDLLPGKVPRISRLMALAIHYDWMLRSGQVDSLDQIARLGHVTQPRVTQILSLNLLAPDIQEELLHWPLIEKGKDPVHERMLRRLTSTVDWSEQRREWSQMKSDGAAL